MSEIQPHADSGSIILKTISGVPSALVPNSIKALDRLVGAAVDIPVAWLNQQKAKIDAKTQAFTLVEASIAKSAAIQAAMDPQTVNRAMSALVRKEYAKQINKDHVAKATITELKEDNAQFLDAECSNELDDDWLNIFERYAEDASTERLQNLWGRVLAGEIRKPGRFSMRTLRFLSEFSQADAIQFANFCETVFGEIAPRSLAKPADQKDIRSIIFLESAGLIQGASGTGLIHTQNFNANGHAFITEDKWAILFMGTPGEEIRTSACVLTPLGQELLALLPGRDYEKAAISVAHAMKSDRIQKAFFTRIDEQKMVHEIKRIW